MTETNEQIFRTFRSKSFSLRQYVISLNLADNDQTNSVHQITIRELIDDQSVIVHSVNHINEAITKLQKYHTQDGILILWIPDEKSGDWRNILEQVRDKQSDTQVIVCFVNDEDGERSRAVQMAGAWAFANPFNSKVLLGYIIAASRIQRRQRVLKEFAQQLDTIIENNKKRYRVRFPSYFQRLVSMSKPTRTRLDRLIAHARNFLQQHIHFDRWTIVLLDHRSKDEIVDQHEYLQRYLLAHEASSGEKIKVNRELLRPIGKDDMMRPLLSKKSLTVLPIAYLRKDKEKLIKYGWKDTSTTRDISTWMCIPLIHVGRIIGIITLDDTGSFYDEQSHTYTEADRVLIEEFAAEFANAIVKLLTARNRRTEQEITRKISEIHDRDEILQVVVVNLKRALNCEECNFYRRSESAGETKARLKLLATTGKLLSNIPEFREGQGIAGKVLERGIAKLVPILAEEDDYIHVRRSIEDAETTSLVCVPINVITSKGKKRTIGVLNAHHNETDYFTPYDLVLLEHIATYVAAVLERTWMLTLAHETHQEINTLKSAANSDDLRNILHVIVSKAMDLTNATAGVIYQFDSPKIEGVSRVTPKDYMTREHLTVRIPENSTLTPPRLTEGVTKSLIQSWNETSANGNKNLQDENALIHQIDNGIDVRVFTKDSGYIKKELVDAGVKAVIGALLIVDQQIRGVLYLNSTSKDTFSSVEQKSLQIFASQASIAIDKARRIYEMDEYTTALRSMAGASTQILQAQSLQQVLQEIVDSLQIIVGGTFTYIVLLNDDPDQPDHLEFRATSPPDVLLRLHKEIGSFDPNNGCELEPFVGRIGITGLAYKNKASYLVHNPGTDNSLIQVNDKKNRIIDGKTRQEVKDNYIAFDQSSTSELAVPIRSNNDEWNDVMGVINVERKGDHPITENHKRVVEFFAEYVAFVIQHHRERESSVSKSKILNQLYLASREFLILRDSDVILRKVVALTREAAEADWVSLILFKFDESDEKWEPVRFETHGEYQRYKPDQVVRTKGISQQVIRSGDHELVSDVQTSKKVNPIAKQLGMKVALCLPFSAQGQHIGVLWLHYKTSLKAPRDKFDPSIDVLKTYANIAATHYTAEFEVVSESIAQDIQKDYVDLRREAYIWFLAAVISGLIGFGFIAYGIHLLVNTSITIGTLSTVLGILFEVAIYMMFQQYREISVRRDNYHNEKLKIKEFENLLVACNEIPDPEERALCKKEIITSVTQNWFGSRTSNL